MKNTTVGKHNTGLERVGATGEKNEKAKNLKNMVSVKKATKKYKKRAKVGMGWSCCHWASYTNVDCKGLVCPDHSTHTMKRRKSVNTNKAVPSLPMIKDGIKMCYHMALSRSQIEII